jgi:hypothetical protein
MKWVVAIALGFVLGACAVTVLVFAIVHRVLFPPTPTKGGDPGNHRLHQLANDPIFHALPPGATSSQLILSPSKYSGTAFQSQGWIWPGVQLTFTSGAPTRSVFVYYAEKAKADGWRPTNILPGLGVARSWEKTYQNGASATVGLLMLGSDRPAGGATSYQLGGGISLPRSA